MERNNNGYTFVRRQGQMISPNVTRRPSMPPRQETLTQHDELIKYIKEAWHKVTTEPGPHGGPVFYREANQPRLPGFTPFDLEGYWGQRLVQNINITQGHQ